MSGLRIVGLGPGNRELMTVAAADAIDHAGSVLLRTARHPAAEQLISAGLACEHCDDIYEAAETLEGAYGSIVERVLSLADADDLVYAVPGSPYVAEATVRLLTQRAGLDVEVVDGLSFVEAVLGAVGVDPLVDGVAVVDGRRIDEHLRRIAAPSTSSMPSLIVAQVDSAHVLAEVKLALLDRYRPEHEVSLVVGAGTRHAVVRRSPLAELDWGQDDPGPLASLYVPAAQAADRPLRPFPVTDAHRAAGGAFADLVALQDRLRSPGGCPWDAAQTHASLSRHLLEEAYEVLDVLDRFPADAPGGSVDPHLYALLEEELGDFVMQAVFHARLAEEAGAFDAEAVVDGIVDKLVLRHPHVFGDLTAGDPAEVVKHWEEIKAAEKGRVSLLDDIPAALPALTLATKVIRRTEQSGLDWAPVAADLLRAADSAVLEVRGRGDDRAAEERLVGHALMALCALARAGGIDPEGALRAGISRVEVAFRDRESADADSLGAMSALDLIS